MIFKYTETNDGNCYVITTANYFMAFIIGIIIIVFTKSWDLFTTTSPTAFSNEFFKVMNSGSQFSYHGSLIWSIITGIAAGIIFFVAFILYQKSVNKNGAALSGTFMKLGILLPMIFSIILWKELPSLIQWLGIVLALSSIIIINLNFRNGILKDIHMSLLLLLIFGGLTEFSNKIFQKYSLEEFKGIFLFTLFFTAFIASLGLTILKKITFKIRDLIFGFIIGIPNLFSAFFMILALKYIKTSVAFPIYGAGTIIIITLGAKFIYNEPIKLKDQIGITLTIIAMILVNL